MRISDWSSDVCSSDLIQKILLPERFRQKLDGARLHCLHAHRNVPVPGDEDDREHDARCGELTLKVESASLWHSDVEDQAGRAIGWVRSDKIFNRRKQPWVHARGTQKSSERFAKPIVVVDDDDAGR